MAMFLAMPFAYFFTESEGFAGSRKVILFTLNLLSKQNLDKAVADFNFHEVFYKLVVF